MRHEQHDDRQDKDDHSAGVWRSAEHRRSDDIHAFFSQARKTRRPLQLQAPRLRVSAAQATSWIWKLLNAARTGLRMTGSH
jgi:hypothetical protein